MSKEYVIKRKWVCSNGYQDRLTGEEIVRCRDCQWFIDIADSCGRVAHGTYDEETGADVLQLADAEPDGFCSWGKRKKARA